MGRGEVCVVCLCMFVCLWLDLYGHVYVLLFVVSFRSVFASHCFD